MAPQSVRTGARLMTIASSVALGGSVLTCLGAFAGGSLDEAVLLRLLDGLGSQALVDLLFDEAWFVF